MFNSRKKPTRRDSNSARMARKKPKSTAGTIPGPLSPDSSCIPSETRFRELLALMLSECEPTAFPGLMVVSTSVVEEVREETARL